MKTLIFMALQEADHHKHDTRGPTYKGKNIIN